MVECQLPKLDVAGSSPVSRSRINNLQPLQKPALFCTTLSPYHEAFAFGIRTTFVPRIESSSFFVAAAFLPMLLFVYTSKDTPMPCPR